MKAAATCSQPDVDAPGLLCGHPLPCPRHPVAEDPQDQLNRVMRDVGRIIAASVEKSAAEHHPDGKVLFCLILCDEGEGGFLSWISNGEREGMVKTVRELIAKVEAGDAGEDRPPFPDG